MRYRKKSYYSIILLFIGYVFANEINIKTSFQDNAIVDLIEQALKLDLKPTDKKESAEADEFVNKSFDDGVMKGDYKQAFKIVMESVEKFPKDFDVQTYLAVLLGDFSSHFTGNLKEKMIQKSKQVFDKLLPELKDHDKNTYYWFMNEYFYRFGRFKDQYELGVKRVDLPIVCNAGSTESRSGNDPGECTHRFRGAPRLYGYHCEGCGRPPRKRFLGKDRVQHSSDAAGGQRKEPYN